MYLTTSPPFQYSLQIYAFENNQIRFEWGKLLL